MLSDPQAKEMSLIHNNPGGFQKVGMTPTLNTQLHAGLKTDRPI